MAVSMNWESISWVSLNKSPTFWSGSGTLVFGNSQITKAVDKPHNPVLVFLACSDQIKSYL